ncbi:MAG: ribonuclease HI [Deltaproteobacteria bacterium]|nr:ribonuclease HI [Deltaproteobacteria bacterium]
MNSIVEIFTDGACKGNPGPGSWAAILKFGPHEKTLSGVDPQTTNNRMEITAAIKALEALKRRCKIKIATDSKYLMLGITQWLKSWKSRNWKTSQHKPVKNSDLWRRLDELNSMHDIEWVWVQGHFGHKENEQADQLARNALKEFLTTQSEV